MNVNERLTKAFDECRNAFADLQTIQVKFNEEIGRLKQNGVNRHELDRVQEDWNIAFVKFQGAQRRFAELLSSVDQWPRPNLSPTLTAHARQQS